MGSPNADGNAIEAAAALSPPGKKSPFSKFLDDLSPIKSSRARVSLCTQRLTESSFTTIPSVFSSPHLDMGRPMSFFQRDGIGGSISNARDPSEVVGEYTSDPEEAVIARNKANDGGAHMMSLVDISHDERSAKMLEFPSENMWHHVGSNGFLEHQAMSTQVLQSNIDHVPPQNMETQWDPQNVSCFNQLRIPYQQFAESQYSSEGNSNTYEIDSCKLCNCKRTNCLKLYCECFAAGIYCDDCCACENCYNKPDYDEIVLETRKHIESRNPLAFAPPIVKPPNDSLSIGGDGNMNNSSARHKRGCKCKRSKCIKKYCECYRAKVGCSDGCQCENCDNSFGKKSEPKFRRAEEWKNRSREMSNTAEVMSDSIKAPAWEKLTDVSSVFLHIT